MKEGDEGHKDTKLNGFLVCIIVWEQEWDSAENCDGENWIKSPFWVVTRLSSISSFPLKPQRVSQRECFYQGFWCVCFSSLHLHTQIQPQRYLSKATDKLLLWTGAATPILYWTCIRRIKSDIQVHVLPISLSVQVPYNGVWWKQNIVHEITYITVLKQSL